MNVLYREKLFEIIRRRLLQRESRRIVYESMDLRFAGRRC